MGHKNVKRFFTLFALGITYGFMYVMPYMKSSFYDQMIAAMQVTNEQLGFLMTAYTIALTIMYIPGGWIADKIKPKKVLIVCVFAQAGLSFLFVFTYTSYAMAVAIWVAMAFSGGLAFWPALLKGIRMQGTDKEQGRLFGIFTGLNNFASLLLSFIMVGILAFVGQADPIFGFQGAVASMGGLAIVAGLLLIFLFDDKAVYNTDEAGKAAAKFDARAFLSTFKMPGVWLMSGLVWCYVTMMAVSAYLTPYSTSVLGLSAVLAASIGALRTYGVGLIGGPLGGFVADKALRSVSKQQILGFVLCTLAMVFFLFAPSGLSAVILVFMILFTGASMFFCKGTAFSVQAELGVPVHVSATAISIASLIGYLPDMYVHTMFGNWLDVYGDAGFHYIFMYGIGMTLFGVTLAAIAYVLSKRVAKKRQAAEEEGVVSESLSK
ncbi:MAG: MFS transporter [Coriobacteriales bacterium]|jgi:sugar phosphate permease|nr:MFS transporter [Coriobacteriales bacterium]